MIYCLFEQSGTFKNVFKKLGMDAIDVDIENQFGETDLIIDLFKSIEKIPNSFIGSITSNDLILAFFPCTWFCDFNMLLLSGKAIQMKKWDNDKKQKYILNRKHQQERAFNLLCKLIDYCRFEKIPLIIENPVSHYLVTNLGKYTIAHRRDIYGDYLQKRTLYYCYNCNIDSTKMKKYPLNKISGNQIKKLRGIHRSLINSVYAENLIKAIEINGNSSFY